MDPTFPNDLDERRKKYLEEQRITNLHYLYAIRDSFDLLKCRDAYIDSYIKNGKYIPSEVCVIMINNEVSDDIIREFMDNNEDYHLFSCNGLTKMTIKYTKFL
jgi:hypothetical protein